MPRTIRSLRLSALLLLLEACASPPTAEPERAPTLGEVATRAAGALGGALESGARVAGRGIGTAFRGVRGGFQAPPPEARYGPYPDGYARGIERHFIRVLRFPKDSRFVMGAPQRGYMNAGLLRGGDVVWTGYVVDVEVDAVEALAGQRAAHSFVVRIRDDEIVDVHRDGGSVRRVEDGSASRTGRRDAAHD